MSLDVGHMLKASFVYSDLLFSFSCFGLLAPPRRCALCVMRARPNKQKEAELNIERVKLAVVGGGPKTLHRDFCGVRT